MYKPNILFLVLICTLNKVQRQQSSNPNIPPNRVNFLPESYKNFIHQKSMISSLNVTFGLDAPIVQLEFFFVLPKNFENYILEF